MCKHRRGAVIKLNKLILIAFMISGMTALIYEVVWTRPLQLIFGSTIYAASTIITTFLAGFALGSYLFRNIAHKTKNPGKLFGIIEIGIGLYGLFVVSIFGKLDVIYLFMLSLPGTQFLQFFLIFLILIIPATLFGATWPVVNQTYVKPKTRGKDIGKLYSVNSFGSFLGPILAGFVLIPLLGIKMTSLLAASLNIFVGILILFYTKKEVIE